MFIGKTIQKNRQIGELSDSEKQEWEVLYEDLQETIKLTETKEFNIGVKTAHAYDGSSASFSNLKKDIEAAMDTNDYGAEWAYASKAAADKANTDQQTYMINNGYSSSLDNTVDAFRHFSWNYHLTDTWYVTRGQAKKMTDNHEFAEKGAYYAINNWPTSSDSWQVYQGQYYAYKLESDCLNASTGATTYYNTFGSSSFMDFNNNEAGRAWESKGFSNNFTAFDDALNKGKIVRTPSWWSYDTLKTTAYNIYKGATTY